MSGPTKIEFKNGKGGKLVADLWDGGGHPVMLLHGGGQTRHAWNKTAMRLRAAGLRAVTVDQRGHGDSDWDPDGDYSFAHYAEDAALIATEIARQYHVAPSAVGASLGGLASLGAEIFHGPLLDSLVMVDITPRMDQTGVARVRGFMRENMHEGFETLEEAAEAIARYLPHRKRPDSLDGLRKNLRLHDDGRYRWHWDPAFMDETRGVRADGQFYMEQTLEKLPQLHLPVLLVRGMNSEIVQEQHAREFLELTPNSRLVDVGGAGHMVAGDRNDIFADAVMDFLAGEEAA
ncbi:MAG: alpha/beta fold hydrolase [Rhizobiaceae bacterium]